MEAIKLTIEGTDDNAIQIMKWLDAWLNAEDEIGIRSNLKRISDKRHGMAESILTTLVERVKKESKEE